MAPRNRFFSGLQICSCLLGRDFPYDTSLRIIENEEYLEDVDIDELRRLRKRDTNYYEIYKKIKNFDENVHLSRSQQKINSWNQQVQKTSLKPRIFKKKMGKPILIIKDRPNYR